MPIRIAIIGFGKIAEDQHLPSIRENPAFELVAIASSRGVGGEHAERIFTDHREMLAGMPDLDAVAICTPAGPRRDIAHDCLAAGKHVLLEKPPAATLGELADLEVAGRESGRTVFAAWHSRFAPAAERARALLSGETLTRLRIDWKEDVRRWHPGQAWIWDPGGFGVFDPGINALSLATRILPQPLFLREALLKVPSNRSQPIAADLAFLGNDMTAGFDWRQTGEQIWTIEIEIADGRHFRLSNGGGRLEIDGKVEIDADRREYRGIYAHFADLIARGESDIDSAPMRLVADAFLLGLRETVAAFDD